MNLAFLAGMVSLPVQDNPLQVNSLKQILQLGPVSLVVLAVLFLFSVGTWAIIYQKWRLYRHLRKSSIEISTYLCEDGDLDSLSSRCSQFPVSPEAQMIRALSTGIQQEASFRRLEHLLFKTVSLEVRKLEGYLGFLATAGSTTPFIGLFGTVWGIMNAFNGISMRGSASLATVAPGIAEALIATAAGLAAAIPAVMAYNFFSRWIETVEGELRDLAAELLMEYGPQPVGSPVEAPVDKTTYWPPGNGRRRRRADREDAGDPEWKHPSPPSKPERRMEW
ncbi:MAG: MotA/TolQ/ExbB proton channel family protein [Candidatus Tectomicrobia bacterium]|uniref:MotA/TolQ/ExbB proton channel family protein n=1 Tax=Tectimicrobiota bacterium TaxID=2528274 RepID=A0A932M1E2_UNCTE|nr:MotA/TolQ/ExbB proton channel family protein [Candidatus Tectomicrobia bacterium]